jgi:hypothetical protein
MEHKLGSEEQNLLTQSLYACQEAVRRYRVSWDWSYEEFRHKGAGWALWLDDVSIKISAYLRHHQHL